MKKNIIGFCICSIFLISLASCKNSKNTTHDTRGNNSLAKELSQIKDTMRLEEFNKQLVADFYQKLFGDKDISAIDNYIAEDYIQHNPSLKDGREALKEGVSQWFKNASKEKVDIQHLGADGDFVYIHTKAIRGLKTISVLDIFRVQSGKITEHWDVIQEVPKKSENPHPMF